MHHSKLVPFLALFVLFSTNACNTQNKSYKSSTNPSITSTPISQPTTGNIADVAANYYDAIAKQNYNLAYTYLDSGATQLLLVSFTQEARSQDQEEGKVQSYSTAAFPPMVIMTVTRANLGPYHVHLQFKLESSKWKIVALERI